MSFWKPIVALHKSRANDLAAKKIHIWDGNGSREFLDGRGLELGDLGPVYEFQWRHFGATVRSSNQSVGIRGLVRSVILLAFCHPLLLQLQYKDMHTDYTGQGVDQLAECIDKINALLTHMIAHVTGRKPGDFIHTIGGDAHVYLNHVDALKVQLEWSPRVIPKLKINSESRDIDGFSYEDFEVIRYNPHKTIAMKMPVWYKRGVSFDAFGFATPRLGAF